MADIEGNIARLKERIAIACRESGRDPAAVTIVAVTKTVKPVDIVRAYECGITNFAENRVQEAEFKIKELSHLKNVTWHLIGRLQSNKVGIAVGLFDEIQSVDSLKLAEAISRQTQRTLPIMLQMNIAGEASKTGFTPEEVALRTAAIKSLPHLEVKGLMTIAPTGATANETRAVFRKLCKLSDSLGLEQLSMGMSGDFEIAIAEGATMIRIGRAIFGERT